MKKHQITGLIVFFLLLGWHVAAQAIQRFPRPDFESGYVTPETLQPGARAGFLELVDLLVLIAAISVTSWAVLKRRSRLLVFWISMFSLAYFGFYREGCVCSIGSIQNVTLAIFSGGYRIPLTVLAFFLIPLVFTLAFGRTFCAGVCPFGALQDLVSFKPLKLDYRINAALDIIPYLYLGLAVLYAATGTDFIICRYDPFVGIFRINATVGMFVFAGILLLSGIFIARPYCRFLCPYGVILNWISRFSWKHLTITPSVCVQCRLCEDSCPYEAIVKPGPWKNPESRRTMVRKFLSGVVLIPVFIFLGGWTGSLLHESLARVNWKVRLAEELLYPAKGLQSPETKELIAFKASGKPAQELYVEATEILNRFYAGGWILGGFIGLAIGAFLLGKLFSRHRTYYEPNRGACFSCARCIDYCPVQS